MTKSAGGAAMNLLAMLKGEDWYFFYWTDAFRDDLLQVLGRFAANPDLNLTWYDATVVSQRIRREGAKRAADECNYT